ncbi:MAG: methionine adenosyltransferase domain-containing protein, partial [Ignavibacteriaceae bacterium]|nr:methionine adenosyltransferase domain-containing protein [Ignavibacteriaceae bacterium]
KVDRSATYAARHIAKNVVAAKLAKECLVQVSYAIGVAEPISVFVDTKGTGVIPDDKISKMITDLVDLTPKGIIKRLKLRRPIYQNTSAYGHFGRNGNEFTWEKLDFVSKFKKYA